MSTGDGFSKAVAGANAGLEELTKQLAQMSIALGVQRNHLQALEDQHKKSQEPPQDPWIAPELKIEYLKIENLAEFQKFLKQSLLVVHAEFGNLKIPQIETSLGDNITLLLAFEETYFSLRKARKETSETIEEKTHINQCIAFSTSICIILKNHTDLILQHFSKQKSHALNISFLFLFDALMHYEYAVSLLLHTQANAEQQQKITGRIATAHDSYAECSALLEMGTVTPFDDLKRILIRNTLELKHLFYQQSISKSELRFHVARKNAQAEEEKGKYHGMVIDDETVLDISAISKKSMQTLYDEMLKVKQSGKRTQFIVFIDGINHALLVDVGWNKQEQFEIICLESTQLMCQHNFLLLLQMKLQENKQKYKMIACQTGLQKNYVGCAVFAYAFSVEISKMSFDMLSKKPNIPQPEFYRSSESAPAPAKILTVDWKDVCVFGEKVVRMGQSTQAMKRNLLKLYANNSNKIAEIEKETLSVAYMDERRENLRQKTKLNVLAGLSYAQIHQKLMKKVNKYNARSAEHALRKVAAGCGSLSTLHFLIAAVPNGISWASEDSKKTPLHWAYKEGRYQRAALLENAKADLNAVDNTKCKPRDYDARRK